MRVVYHHPKSLPPAVDGECGFESVTVTGQSDRWLHISERDGKLLVSVRCAGDDSTILTLAEATVEPTGPPLTVIVASK